MVIEWKGALSRKVLNSILMSRYKILLQFLVIPLAIVTSVAVYPSYLHAQAISGSISRNCSGRERLRSSECQGNSDEHKYRCKDNRRSQWQWPVSSIEPSSRHLRSLGSRHGFNTSILKGVYVQLNQTSTANLTIQVGRWRPPVEVGAAGTTIDTTTAQIANTYTAKEAADLPVTTMDSGVINLSLLQSGVSSSGGGVGTGPSIGGQRPRNNNFTVEGMDDNSKSSHRTDCFIPNESVAEFTFLQNQFQAEYGHSSGGQFNTVVKSGTNEFHGELYDYLRNRNLNALDQTFRALRASDKLPRFDRNRLGANVGGPDQEETNCSSSLASNTTRSGRPAHRAAPVYAPTAAGYTALGGASGVSQTNLGILKQYAELRRSRWAQASRHHGRRSNGSDRNYSDRGSELHQQLLRSGGDGL